MIAVRVRDILENNKAERHLRGGEATRQKYRREKDALMNQEL
jgi:putative DeoR family transcriptional regulator (stage III sporulation protein D)